MNQAHIHLLVNHLPIIFPFIGLLILIAGIVFNSDAVKRTAFSIFILSAIATLAAMASGDGAEEVVENIQGIDETLIKIHEESAEIFAVLAYLLGTFSIVAFWANIKQRSFASILNYLLVVFAIVIMFFAYKTGSSGGEIRHSEIRSNANVINTGTIENQENNAGKNDDDD